ncbi:MAG: nucleotidyltransferase domain-containing protein [Peptoniphilaceae bacterium]
MKFTEDQLKSYARPLSDTEEIQCKNSVQMVADALKILGLSETESLRKSLQDTHSYEIRMSSTGNRYNIKIFLQGSYANNTNVRTHSDVDIAVITEDRFHTKYRPGITDEHYRFSTYQGAKSFKDEVEEALRYKFGSDVERKNKCIKIHGNSYRKDADSVPATRYRDYSNDYLTDPDNYVGGMHILTDLGEVIINYPEQHLTNGVEKNKNTNYYFKKMVRIAKELRYQMCEKGHEWANKTSSFGVECLLWNVPDKYFKKWSLYRFAFEEIVDYLYDHRFDLLEFKEVNNIKYLCDDDISRKDIYKGFITELKEYYDYEI